LAGNSSTLAQGSSLANIQSGAFEFQNKRHDGRRRLKQLSARLEEFKDFFDKGLHTSQGVEDCLPAFLLVTELPQELDSQVSIIQEKADTVSTECESLKIQLADTLAETTFGDNLEEVLERKRTTARDLKSQIAQKTAEQKRLLHSLTVFCPFLFFLFSLGCLANLVHALLIIFPRSFRTRSGASKSAIGRSRSRGASLPLLTGPWTVSSSFMTSCWQNGKFTGSNLAWRRGIKQRPLSY